MEWITWPVVAAIFAGGVPFLAFLYGILKKPTDGWKTPIANLEKEIAILKTKITNIEDKVESVDKDQDTLDNRVLKRMDDLENKIDRFVEILISYFGNK